MFISLKSQYFLWIRNPFGQTYQPHGNIYPNNAAVTSAEQLMLFHTSSVKLNLLLIVFEIS